MGVSLAFLQVNIIATALAVGCATLIMSTLGMMVGRFIGSIIGKKAEILGGLVLIGIGVQRSSGRTSTVNKNAARGEY